MRPRIREEKVTASTGKGWAHWFQVLDTFDCKRKGHKESARFLKEKHALSDWWSQTVTIEYEIARGLRRPLQRSDTLYAIDVQRTVRAPVSECWRAFTVPSALNKWFASKASVDLRVGGLYTGAGGDRCTYKKIVPKKRLVMSWEHPVHTAGSVVTVVFTANSEKTTVRVSHSKIANKREADDLKKAWSGVMDAFRTCIKG